MSREVLLCAFKKAENDIGSNKKTHLSTHIADVLQEKYGLLINERTLRDYYTNFNKNEEGYYTELKPRLIERLCKYLGYSNYADFVTKNVSEKYKIAKYVPKRYMPFFACAISFISIGLSLYFESRKETNICLTYFDDFSSQYLSLKSFDEGVFSLVKKQGCKKAIKVDSITNIKNKGVIIWFSNSNEKAGIITDKMFD